MSAIKIPLNVPKAKYPDYHRNYDLATAGTGRLLLIAGDQKVEHLNDDFFGAKISPEDAGPEHLFKIAAGTKGALFATHLGLIAQYGGAYRGINYLVKINGKSNLGHSEEKNSSSLWWSLADVIKFKKDSGLNIVGVGYTLYLGGKYEAEMLTQAARAISEAHQNGLLAILWVYPRAKNVNEENIHTIAGAAGIAACLGADFVKVKYPYASKNNKLIAEKYKEVIAAAGQTKVICVGGAKRANKEMLTTTSEQLAIAGTAGLAIGRNLHQRPLSEALKLANDLSVLIHAANPKKKRSSWLGIF